MGKQAIPIDMIYSIESDELFKKYETSKEVNCFKVETFDKSFSFLVKVGFQLHSKAVDDDDIVFLEMLEGNENAKMNDIENVEFIAGDTEIILDDLINKKIQQNDLTLKYDYFRRIVK